MNRMIKVTPQITVALEGNLSDVFHAVSPKDMPSLDTVLATMAELAFLVETVAHLQGREAALLPTADKARRLIALLQPKEITA